PRETSGSNEGIEYSERESGGVGGKTIAVDGIDDEMDVDEEDNL
ncbi:16537_t:CDS:1, partial [Gigaspora rosea]